MDLANLPSVGAKMDAEGNTLESNVALVVDHFVVERNKATDDKSEDALLEKEISLGKYKNLTTGALAPLAAKFLQMDTHQSFYGSENGEIAGKILQHIDDEPLKKDLQENLAKQEGVVTVMSHATARDARTNQLKPTSFRFESGVTLHKVNDELKGDPRHDNELINSKIAIQRNRKCKNIKGKMITPDFCNELQQRVVAYLRKWKDDGRLITYSDCKVDQDPMDATNVIITYDATYPVPADTAKYKRRESLTIKTKTDS